MAHAWPLALVAVAAAPEHDQDAARAERPQHIERPLQRVRRVRIVDQAQHTRRVGYAFEAARNPGHPADAGGNCVAVKPVGQRHAGGQQDIGQVELTHEG